MLNLLNVYKQTYQNNKNRKPQNQFHYKPHTTSLKRARHFGNICMILSTFFKHSFMHIG